MSGKFPHAVECAYTDDEREVTYTFGIRYAVASPGCRATFEHPGEGPELEFIFDDGFEVDITDRTYGGEHSFQPADGKASQALTAWIKNKVENCDSLRSDIMERCHDDYSRMVTSW